MDSKYYCEKCNYRTDIASCYKQHLETTLHKTGKRKERCDKTLHKCKDCNYENYNKKNFLIHVLNNHSTIEERKSQFTYYCECCDFGIFVKSMMDTHLKTNKHILKCNDNKTDKI
jgi:hypothetical protein